ncbi:MAG: DNA circularization N-terminal domain-containing protein [Chloroflexi bacterium]|nr:DNA circularization N-terminal domain-containing protein [Chloroflexota bacterium]
MPIEIGGIILNHIHRLATIEQAAMVAHRIPGLEGSVVQNIGRASVQLQVEGIFYGATSRDDLEALRSLYKAREPVDFLADIVGESYFSQVVVTRMEVYEAASSPEEFGFLLHIMEYVEPPEPEAEPDFSAVDASILEDAQNFMDAVTLPDLIGGIPDITNPLAPLDSALDGVEEALSGLSSVTGSLQSLFGIGGG